MARPRKDGVDYFPFEVDFFSDNKIKIVRSRYGSDGVAIYIYLLCEIYRDKGYYLQCNEDTDCLVAAELGMSTDKVGQIKAYLLGRSLFDNTLFRSAEVLSSKGIQRRFQQAVKGRAAKNPVVVREDLWLLDEEETEPFIKVRHKDGSSENNPDNSRNNTSNSKKNTTNQSKVNQSKENHSKSSPAQACEETVASLPDDDFDDPDQMIVKAVERDVLGKTAAPHQLNQINDLLRWYPHGTILAAIEKTKKAGGRSIDYLKKVIETIPESWSSRGVYEATYNKSEIESLMDEEFYSELEDWDE